MTGIIKTDQLQGAQSSTITVPSGNNLTVSGAFTSQGIDDNANATAITIDTSENVGIGTSSPSSYYAKDLVISSPDEGGITIVQEAGHRGYLAFADGTSGSAQYRGYVSYDHNDDMLYLGTDGGGKLFINTSGNVGIGTTPSGARLHVDTAVAGYAGKFVNDNTATDANGILIQAGSASTEYALNVANTAGSTNFLVVKGNGRVGIGTTSPTNKLHVKGTGAEQINLETSGGATTILAIALKNSANTWQIENGRASNVLSVRCSTYGETIRSHSNGVTSFNAGIALGVGLNNTASNVLDDYEEGTWTGTWYGSGGTNDSANTNLKYVKIGKTVTVSGNTTGNVNATGPLELRGLPFTAEDDATGAPLYRYTTAASGQHTLVFYVGANQSKIEPYWAAGGNYDKLNSSDFTSSGRDMYFSITYKAQ